MPSNNMMAADYEQLLASEGMPAELPSLFADGVHFQFKDQQSTELERAGVDAGTDTEVFLAMNGRNTFVTGEDLCLG